MMVQSGSVFFFFFFWGGGGVRIEGLGVWVQALGLRYEGVSLR